MPAPPNPRHHGSKPYELSIFDVRTAGIAERLHSERAGWKGSGDVEALDEDHFVLIVRPGGAKRGAA